MNVLHPVRKKAYCGPTVISAITGIDIDSVHREIKRVTPDREHSDGMSDKTLIQIMKTFGWYVSEIIPGNKKLTLTTFVVNTPSFPCIIHVSEHYVATFNFFVYDTSTTYPLTIANWLRTGRDNYQVYKAFKFTSIKHPCFTVWGEENETV